ncbi:ATP-binding protein [Longimicrobium sp.]|uniref:ATP-binding protein n=1 Tax=Longimicrobium sp. TaxID=2029185 RepID=UPI002E2F6852|nr:ATP-binding protein [Longimicrobium sp.]HEX6039177.1 ATP-binding protein [Longimicrobium sp.]
MTRSPRAPRGESPRGVPLGGALPLAWKLPLLMTVLLAAGLAGILAFTYATLRDRAEVIVRGRLQSAVQQVAGAAAESMAWRARDLREAARAPAVTRVLRARGAGRAPSAGDDAAARAVLATLLAPRDSALTVELWDADGRTVAFAGAAPPADRRMGPGDGAWAPGRMDSVWIGPLHAAGDRVRFWLVAPVVDGGTRTGYVARALYAGSPPGALRMMHDFIGEEFTLYTRNADGSFWFAAPGEAAPAPAGRDSTSRGLVDVRPGVGRLAVAEAPVAGTPWRMVLASPMGWIAQRPRETLRQLSLVSLLVILAAAAVTWITGRRLARPLATLTAAAEGVARGAYDVPVMGRGRDEVGRLAASFDSMARQVQAARAELERRVADAQRARAEAEQARTDAELASRAKSDFLAVMSHELRTPLNAIGGYAELMEMGLHGPVTEAQRDALARIVRSQAHLLTLINDVLSFARIEAGTVQYAMADVPLREALAELEGLVAPQVRASRLHFRLEPCDPAVVVRADGDKVRQVVLNLLANAIKYTQAGGSVVLACDADEARVRIHVRDTGTGIRAERLPHIFDPFVQGERALNRPDEGVGLGLAISRDLARGMGGELEVESEPGRGSTFTLVLRRASVLSAVPA